MACLHTRLGVGMPHERLRAGQAWQRGSSSWPSPPARRAYLGGHSTHARHLVTYQQRAQHAHMAGQAAGYVAQKTVEAQAARCLATHCRAALAQARLDQAVQRVAQGEG